jgi:hypothetical protein
VFGAPPADATNVCGVVVYTGGYWFAALVAVLLWWLRVVLNVFPLERFDAFTHDRFCFFGPHLFFGVADKEYACCGVAVGCWLYDLKGVASA